MGLPRGDRGCSTIQGWGREPCRPNRERAVVVHREGARGSAGDEREGSSSGEALHGDSELRVAEEGA